MAWADADDATFTAKATEVRELSGQVLEARARTMQEIARGAHSGAAREAT
jgi:hypothetical protein